MGTYRVVIIEQSEGVGLFLLHTNMGQVAMVFADTGSLDQFVAYYQRYIGPDRRLGMVEITASSLTEAMERLKEGGLGWSADTTFVTNGQEPFEQLMAPIREDLASS
jgi:hypothetical protein